MKRNHLAPVLAVLAAVFAFTSAASAADELKKLRIGHQKSSTLVAVLKANGELEKGLNQLGYTVAWSEFPSGLPLLEALNVGAVDLSGDVADTVPVFAQAAGAKLTYVATEAPSPAAQALLVKADSPIKTIADLKGKKVAVTKAAGVHYLLIKQLNSVGLKLSDIEPAFLTPADGRAAFEKGAVDAWIVWDPFVSAAQKQSSVRIVADSKGFADYARFYLASSAFAAEHPDVLRFVFGKLQETGKWVKAHPDEAAKILAPVWGLTPEIVTLANSHRSYDVRAVQPDNLVEVQKIADAFFAEGALPKNIKASEAQIWSPDKQASAK